MAALRNVVLLMFFVFLAKNIFGYVHQYTLAVVQGRVTRDIRRDLYQHLLRLDLPFFASTRAGQTIVRLTSDIDQLRMLVTTNVAQAILADAARACPGPERGLYSTWVYCVWQAPGCQGPAWGAGRRARPGKGERAWFWLACGQRWWASPGGSRQPAWWWGPRAT